jgi:hypothetical protein
MSLGTFTMEIDDFMAKARARGFKVIPIETRPGHFTYQAQDPDLEPSSPITPQMIERFTDLNLADAGPLSISQNPNERREAMEGEINSLLLIHRRSQGDMSDPENQGIADGSVEAVISS